MDHLRTRPSSAGVGWLRGKRILLAEDNITNQMVANQMLDALGATVEVANDGAEALEMLRGKPYDLYLIDIEMPRVSGLDVIRSIRASAPPLRDAPVIAVTAYALREHREKITEAGADGLIPKPLLGIEQFGRDIVKLADRSYERGAGGETTGSREVETISHEVFDSLAESIGPDAMEDLLSKIDQDLGRVEQSIGEAERRGDGAAMGAAAHILVSVAGAVGATRLQGLARKLNGLAEGRGLVDANSLVRDTLQEIAAVRSFIEQQATNAKG